MWPLLWGQRTGGSAFQGRPGCGKDSAGQLAGQSLPGCDPWCHFAGPSPRRLGPGRVTKPLSPHLLPSPTGLQHGGSWPSASTLRSSSCRDAQMPAGVSPAPHSCPRPPTVSGHQKGGCEGPLGLPGSSQPCDGAAGVWVGVAVAPETPKPSLFCPGLLGGLRPEVSTHKGRRAPALGPGTRPAPALPAHH